MGSWLDAGKEEQQCQTWKKGTSGQACWGPGESDPPAEQTVGAVRPHMKVQKSRAPDTG